jgi:hypothetical protein
VPRRGPLVTREHADRIVRKLNAAVDRGRGAHDLASVYYQDTLVLQFGIRRSYTLRLANCPMSYEEWVERMKQKKVIS